MQRVVATLSNGINASTLQCEFITGSDATGCMVVLTSEYYSLKTQYNLTRSQSKISEITLRLEHPPSCYTGVEAFDIESDGSVGTLPVPGQLVVISHTQCTPEPPVSGNNYCPYCFYSEAKEHRHAMYISCMFNSLPEFQSAHIETEDNYTGL